MRKVLLLCISKYFLFVYWDLFNSIYITLIPLWFRVEYFQLQVNTHILSVNTLKETEMQ